MNLVTYSVSERIAFITLNRPEKRNALNPELVTALMTAFTQAENDEHVRVVILKANGDAFCAGADLAYLHELQHFSFEENLKDSGKLKDLFLKIYSLKKIIIAQVQGHALAGGCGLTNVCDFVFSVPEAKFGYTEVKIGFVPALVSVFLLRKVGEQKAKQLLLTGDPVQGDDAIHAGLVNHMVDKNELESTVLKFAQKLIKGNSGQSLALTKKLIADVQLLKLDDALQLAARVNAEARGTDDCKKGIAAFLNKQELSW